MADLMSEVRDKIYLSRGMSCVVMLAGSIHETAQRTEPVGKTVAARGAQRRELAAQPPLSAVSYKCTAPTATESRPTEPWRGPAESHSAQ